MTQRKRTAAPVAGEFIAFTDIMIDGKVFLAGHIIAGVDQEQIAIAVRLGRAGATGQPAE